MRVSSVLPDARPAGQRPDNQRRDGLPVLRGFLSPDRQHVRVYCPHCRDDHLHGAGGIADGLTPHRLAHCRRPGSPFARTGYIVLVGEPSHA